MRNGNTSKPSPLQVYRDFIGQKSNFSDTGNDIKTTANNKTTNVSHTKAATAENHTNRCHAQMWRHFRVNTEQFELYFYRRFALAGTLLNVTLLHLDRKANCQCLVPRSDIESVGLINSIVMHYKIQKSSQVSDASLHTFIIFMTITSLPGGLTLS